MKVGYEILKSLGLRHRGVNIISCPSCARQGFDVIKTVEALEKRLEHIKTPMSLSIIGCVVNGPGEALMTDVGFTGGGAGSGMVYLAGKQSHKLSNDEMVEHIVEQVETQSRRDWTRRRARCGCRSVRSGGIAVFQTWILVSANSALAVVGAHRFDHRTHLVQVPESAHEASPITKLGVP